MKPLLFALLLTTLPAHAQSLTSPIPTDPKLTHGTLKNGVQYYILPNKRPTAKAELRLVVQAGSLHEADDQRGLAHFVEHMAFNGTAHFPKQSLVDQLQKMGVQFGADLNAYTNSNETVYILPVPLSEPDNLNTGLQVLEDWAFHMSLDDAAIEQERNIIVEEWRMRTQDPSAKVQEQSRAAALTGSRYPERYPIGEMNVVRHAPAARLRDFYRTWYRPNLMSVIVVGDVNVAKTRAMIEQKFGDKPNPAQPVAAPSSTVANNIEPIIGVFTEPNLPNNSVTLIQKPLNDSSAEVTLNDYLSKQKHRLINLIINERLNALKDRNPPPFIQAATYQYFLYGEARSKNSYVATAHAATGAEADALRALHLEHRRIIDHGFTQAELDRARSQMLADLTNGYNNRAQTESKDKAEEYIRGVVERESLPSYEWEYAISKKYLPNIKLSELNALAKSYFTEPNRIVLINSSQRPDLSEAQIRAIIDSKPVTTPSTSVSAGELLKHKPTAGRVLKQTFDPALNLTTWQLSNGVTVHLKNTDFNRDAIAFSGYNNGGYSQLSDEVWRKTQWAYGGLSETGVNGYSNTQLQQLLAGRVLDVNTVINDDSQGFNGQFAPKDSETALQLIYSHATGMNHDPAAFARYVQRGMARTANLANDRMSEFGNFVEQRINRNNPRFTRSYPDASAWQATDYETAFQNRQKLFANANGMQFTFVGKINPQQFKPLVETYLGGLPSNLSEKPAYKDNGYRLAVNGQKFELKKGREPLSMVYIGIHGQAPFNPQEDLALRAIGEILTIKLTEDLREKEGGVYSINAGGYMRSRPYGEYNFVMQFPCAPDKTEQLIQSAQRELDALIQNGPSASDLDKFKKATQIKLREQLKTNNYWVNAIETHLKRGIAPQEILNEEQRLLALSPAEVQAVAQKYLAVKAGVAVLKPE
ncbi:MAG: M16 family metallopeptidase [Formosimonas sp.]